MFEIFIAVFAAVVVVSAFVLYLKGYRLIREDHLQKMEQDWYQEIVNENEMLYADDLVELRTEIAALETDLDLAYKNIKQSDAKILETHQGYQAFLNELIQHSLSEDFMKKYKTKQALADYYNSTLKKAMELVSEQRKI